MQLPSLFLRNAAHGCLFADILSDELRLAERSAVCWTCSQQGEQNAIQLSAAFFKSSPRNKVHRKKRKKQAQPGRIQGNWAKTARTRFPPQIIPEQKRHIFTVISDRGLYVLKHILFLLRSKNLQCKVSGRSRSTHGYYLFAEEKGMTETRCTARSFHNRRQIDWQMR